MSFNDKIEGARETEGLGKIADSDSWFVTQKMAEGDFEFQIDDRNILLILTSLFGASPVKAGSSPWTYTYTLANTNQHQSLSLLWQDPDTTKAFGLAVVNSLKVTVDINGIVTGQVNFMARVGKDWTAQTADFTAAGSKFLHQYLIFKLATTTAGLAGATAISLKKLEFTISSNTKFDYVLGTVEPEDILNQQFSVEGQLELNKTDETYRNLMLGNTYNAMDITFLGSASSKWQLQFPRCDFTAWEPDYTLDQIASQKINFKCNYDQANAVEIISTCIVTSLLNSTNT